MSVEDSGSPPLKARKPIPVPVYRTPSPPVQTRIKRVLRSPAPAQLNPPLPKPSVRSFQLQAHEDSDGCSSVPGSNSSDDADASDLSYVSQGSAHSNAEQHVYAAGASSQGGFPTPLHMRRAADRGLLSIADCIENRLKEERAARRAAIQAAADAVSQKPVPAPGAVASPALSAAPAAVVPCITASTGLLPPKLAPKLPAPACVGHLAHWATVRPLFSLAQTLAPPAPSPTWATARREPARPGSVPPPAPASTVASAPSSPGSLQPKPTVASAPSSPGSLQPKPRLKSKLSSERNWVQKKTVPLPGTEPPPPGSMASYVHGPSWKEVWAAADLSAPAAPPALPASDPAPPDLTPWPVFRLPNNRGNVKFDAHRPAYPTRPASSSSVVTSRPLLQPQRQPFVSSTAQPVTPSAAAALAATDPATLDSMPPKEEPKVPGTTCPLPMWQQYLLAPIPALDPSISNLAKNRFLAPLYQLPPDFVPPPESPSLLHVLQSYLNGHMAYMEARNRLFVRTEFAEFKTFLKAEYAEIREFMRNQTALTHISVANELAKALTSKPQPGT